MKMNWLRHDCGPGWSQNGPKRCGFNGEVTRPFGRKYFLMSSLRKVFEFGTQRVLEEDRKSTSRAKVGTVRAPRKTGSAKDGLSERQNRNESRIGTERTRRWN